jgi:hypothetical protein
VAPRPDRRGPGRRSRDQVPVLQQAGLTLFVTGGPVDVPSPALQDFQRQTNR